MPRRIPFQRCHRLGDASHGPRQACRLEGCFEVPCTKSRSPISLNDDDQTTTRYVCPQRRCHQICGHPVAHQGFTDRVVEQVRDPIAIVLALLGGMLRRACDPLVVDCESAKSRRSRSSSTRGPGLSPFRPLLTVEGTCYLLSSPNKAERRTL